MKRAQLTVTLLMGAWCIAGLAEGAPQIQFDRVVYDFGKTSQVTTVSGVFKFKNVGEAITREIIEERIRRGPFQSFAEFLNRIQHKDLNKKSLESLIKTGAFDSLGLERNQGLSNLEDIIKFTNMVRKGNSNGNGNSLFGNQPIATPILNLKSAPAAAPGDKLTWEKELLGFYLSDHPLNSHLDVIARVKAKPISEARNFKDEDTKIIIAGCVSKVQKITTKNGQPMLFATIEDMSPQTLEVVVFNSTLAKTAPAWEVNNVILVEGRMSFRNDEVKMICDRAQKIG